MRLLDRYLLREFLIALTVCLCAFLLFWVAFDLFSELRTMQDKHLRAPDIAAFYLFKAPEFLVLVLPMALLLGVLYALTTHARHNEITAIRASGVSLWRLCVPYLGVGFLCSLGLFWLNEYCVPRTADAAERVLNSRIERRLTAEERQQIRKFVFINNRERREWHADVYNQETGEMSKMDVRCVQTNGGTITYYADRAVRTNGVWTLYHVQPVKQVTTTNALPITLPRVDSLAFPDFKETPAEINNEIDINSRLSPGNFRGSKGADIPIAAILTYLRLNPRPPPDVRRPLLTKLHARLAAPWACLVVVLIGAPFAAASGRRNVFVGVAASIFFCFGYFILQQFSFALGAHGHFPAWLAAWLPNLLFGFAGIWMMIRTR
jgi:lipopolysaccharide export system permease protein